MFLPFPVRCIASVKLVIVSMAQLLATIGRLRNYAEKS